MRRLVRKILRRLGTLGHGAARMRDPRIPTDAPERKARYDRRRANPHGWMCPSCSGRWRWRWLQSDGRATKYGGLVNAVLRVLTPRCAREGQR